MFSESVCVRGISHRIYCVRKHVRFDNIYFFCSYRKNCLDYLRAYMNYICIASIINTHIRIIVIIRFVIVFRISFIQLPVEAEMIKKGRYY